MSDIRQVMKITQDGDCVIFPSDTWTDHAAKAVSEVTVPKTEHYDKDGDLRSISTHQREDASEAGGAGPSLPAAQHHRQGCEASSAPP